MEKDFTGCVIIKGNMMKPFTTKTQTHLFKCTLSFQNKLMIGGPTHGRSRRGVRDKPMSCKPGVAGSIPGFSQSVG